jgi:hypothetical protein
MTCVCRQKTLLRRFTVELHPDNTRYLSQLHRTYPETVSGKPCHAEDCIQKQDVFVKTRDDMQNYAEKKNPLQEMETNQVNSISSDNQAIKSKTNNKTDAKPTGFPKKKWTILIYSSADNNLEPELVKNIVDIEKVGSPRNVNFLVQLDRGENPSEISGQWAGARRFKLEESVNPDIIDSPVLKEMGQINMADPRHLQDFIEWGMTNYPAKHYMLVIAGHGAGWHGAVEDISDKGWMHLPEIGDAIGAAKESTGKKLDIIGFDACLMGQTEVAYELRNHADFLVASEENVGGDGWPYETIMSKETLRTLNSAMLSKANVGPEDLARLIVKASSLNHVETPTMSAIDLKQLDNIAHKTVHLAKAIVETKTLPSTLKSIVRNTQSFEGHRDYYDFCRRINESGSIRDEELKSAARDVMDAISDGVISHQKSEKHTDANGLSIHLPAYRDPNMERYQKTAFSKDTGWDQAINKIITPNYINPFLFPIAYWLDMIFGFQNYFFNQNETEQKTV